ncbi:methyl-accepting chemotaxis protein [Noviherbaspirillum sp. CPCC 100848]|uniref:Methyl-accepting chemotaxis protein n=1 Tax=Noviherbaspirillum album TaxID=3080276 RepID=A0ABU6J8E8_9BURK|nr:methyl-accepting chemotaxis protein [Noviherbaspirillum sp. CPCC 100848]MEC4719932.1 methyl-accepting chemotaxis protein [Noviherbaspirillum sp. CPCC 100848]
MKLQDMKIGTRLTLGFGILLLLMLALSAFSISRLLSIDNSVALEDKVIMDRLQPLYQAREALGQTGIAARNSYIFTSLDDAKRELDIVDQQKTIFMNALKSATPHYAGDADFAKVSKGLTQMAEELNRPRKYREADQMQEFGEFLVKECSPLRRQIVADMDVVIRNTEKEMANATVAVHGIISFSRTLLIAVSAIALAIGIALAFFLARSITGPLTDAVNFARRVTTGDLTGRIAATSRDETGQLMVALKEMNENLARIVTEVRSGTEQIAAGSTQIASGNQDLSARTEQQAASLGKTASSMEELTSTVTQNAENAQQANALAVSAAQVASEGGLVIAQVVDTMGAINDSSRKVVDIISVIDGIAFQTNILALNAAVEAARAGEQGRGFAVVASEVRSLAQRSAAAAREIKSLIDDSVEKVENGSKLVDQAGTTMNNIVEGVRRVTDIIGEITAASREQTTGIHEVNSAIAQMDQVTQQNAALVEQAAAASESMQDQAAQLAQVVSVFKLDAGQAYRTMPSMSAAGIGATTTGLPRVK